MKEASTLPNDLKRFASPAVWGAFLAFTFCLREAGQLLLLLDEPLLGAGMFIAAIVCAMLFLYHYRNGVTLATMQDREVYNRLPRTPRLVMWGFTALAGVLIILAWIQILFFR